MTKVGMAASRLFRFSQEPPENVCHYTTGDGLKGIVQKKALWASAAYYLNDTSEVEYGCRMAAGLIDSALSRDQSPLVNSALSELSRNLKGEPNAQMRSQTIFLSCFCESDNLLSQWRAYGRPGGFALSFKSARVLELRPKFGSLSTALVRVLYDRDEQESSLRALIDKVSELLVDPAITTGALTGPWARGIERAVGEYLSQTFMSLVTSFKSPAFAEELEWRLVARPFFTSFPTVPQDGLAEVRKIVDFRSTERGLVPYIELTPLANVRLADIISQVRFGPTANPGLARSATRLLLDSNDLESVEVVGSDISVLL